jgi:hypothetical protein
MKNTNYVILEESDFASIDFSEVLEDSLNTLRYSLDGTKTFVNYEGDQPSFLSGKQEYTHSEILAILAGDEWTSDEIS